MSTSFCTTGVTVTPGGGGAGFSSSDAHPERVLRSSSDTKKNREALTARLRESPGEEIDVVLKSRPSTIRHLDSAAIRFASGFRRLRHTNHTKRMVLMIAVRSDLFALVRLNRNAEPG